LQGANIPGADSRCAPKGTSALFAFLHVAQPTDAFGSPSYKIGVRGRNSAPFEPIDSLQKIFNKNVSCGSSGISETVIVSRVYSVVPNPVWNEFSINLIHGTVSPGLGTVALYSLQGQKIWELPFAVGKPYTTANLPGGTYRLEWVVDGEWHYQSIIKQ